VPSRMSWAAGNGFAIGKNAPPEAIDFVSPHQRGCGQARLLPPVTGIRLSLRRGMPPDRSNMIAVQKAFTAASYFQLYYDQYMPSAMGSAINDAVCQAVRWHETPDQGCQGGRGWPL